MDLPITDFQKTMLKTGILNPAILSLIARVRHTNMLVIADRGFPFWPQIETIDLSLVDGLPTVNQVLEALIPAVDLGRAYMAEQFKEVNPTTVIDERRRILGEIELIFEDHEETFKKRVPSAIGLIRTSDTTQYSNIILVSA
jgi:D-ribose pyranase